MIDHCEKVLVKDKTDINAMKELTAKLSAIEETEEEFIESDNEDEYKDESYDDNIMLKFDEDCNFIG